MAELLDAVPDVVPAEVDASEAINARLAMHISGSFTLENGGHSAMTELLDLYESSLESAAELAGRVRKLETDLSLEQRAKESLRDDLAIEQEEVSKFREQLNQVREDHRVQRSKLMSANADLEKQRCKLQGKDTAYVAKVRKLEQETTKLQDQVQKLLSKKGEKRGGVALVVPLPGSQGGSASGETEQFLTRVGEAYASQLCDLRSENAEWGECVNEMYTKLITCCGEAQAASSCTSRLPVGHIREQLGAKLDQLLEVLEVGTADCQDELTDARTQESESHAKNVEVLLSPCVASPTDDKEVRRVFHAYILITCC